MSAVAINNQAVQVKEWKNQRVVTFKDIDMVHERAKGTASRNFRENRKHFIEGEDFYDVTVGNYKSDEIRRAGFNNPRGGFLITESGYLMLVKSFTDDLAWDVQRQLVKSYFRAKDERLVPVSEDIDRLTYKGEPVMITSQLSKIMKVSGYMIRANTSYEVLKGPDMFAFRRENHPKLKMTSYEIAIFRRDEVIELARALGFPEDQFYGYFNMALMPASGDKLENYKRFMSIYNLDLLQRANSHLFINPEFRGKLNLLISEEYVKLGLLDTPSEDLGINSKAGWSLYANLNEYYRTQYQ